DDRERDTRCGSLRGRQVTAHSLEIFRRVGVGARCGTLESVYNCFSTVCIQAIEPCLDDDVVFRKYEVIRQELLAVAATESIVVSSEPAIEESTKGAESSALESRRLKLGSACMVLPSQRNVGRNNHVPIKGGTAHHMVQMFSKEARLRNQSREEPSEYGEDAGISTGLVLYIKLFRSGERGDTDNGTI